MTVAAILDRRSDACNAFCHHVFLYIGKERSVPILVQAAIGKRLHGISFLLRSTNAQSINRNA